jgi:hypothetical protein
MNSYKIELILSEENLAVVRESLTTYKGKKKLIAQCIKALIERQVEIQKKAGNTNE